MNHASFLEFFWIFLNDFFPCELYIYVAKLKNKQRTLLRFCLGLHCLRRLIETKLNLENLGATYQTLTFSFVAPFGH